PFSTIIQGNKVLKEYLSPSGQSGDIGAIADAISKAGGKVGLDEVYSTAIRQRMMHAFRNGNWAGGLLRAPFAAVELVSDVIMKEIVPRQKLGVFADLARFEIARLGAGATDAEVAKAMQDAWDSVDNRMGQMVYDN